MFGRAARHPGALLKTLAFLITLVALAATVPRLDRLTPNRRRSRRGPCARRSTRSKTGSGPETGAGPGASSRVRPAGGQWPSGAAHGSASAAAPRAAAAEQVPVGPVLDQLSASIKQIEASLERNDRTDAELQDLRQQIDPVSAAFSGALDRLTSRLDAIKTRLDQLGPKPDDSSPPKVRR